MELVTDMRLAASTSGGTSSGASNGTAFLLDTSIPESASAEKQALVLELTRRLTQILAFSMSSTLSFNPLFFTKFDATRSWFCYEWACLGRCDAFEKLETEFDQFSAGTPSDSIDLVSLV